MHGTIIYYRIAISRRCRFKTLVKIAPPNNKLRQSQNNGASSGGTAVGNGASSNGSPVGEGYGSVSDGILQYQVCSEKFQGAHIRSESVVRSFIRSFVHSLAIHLHLVLT